MSFQQELDLVKLSDDESLEQMKKVPITKGSPFLTNAVHCITGGTGSGKTSLLAKILVLHEKHLDNVDIFYFHSEDSQMDSTMAENINKYRISLTAIPSNHMEEFLDSYIFIKKTVIEFYKYYTRDDYWSSGLQEIKDKLKGSILPKAKEWLKKYSEDSNITVQGKEYPIKAMVDENGKFTYSVCVWDDIMSFKGFSGSFASNFFARMASQNRHWLACLYFSFQRVVMLNKTSRNLTSCWCLGFNQTTEDITDLVKKTISAPGYSSKELIEMYQDVDKYEFLVINQEVDFVDIIKVNK